MNRSGQSALFDASLFLLVMTVASSLILIHTSATLDAQTAALREGDMAYADATLLALLRVTLDNVTYTGRGGEIVRLADGLPVGRLLVDQLALRWDGLEDAAFGELNQRILHVLDALVRPPYRHALIVAHVEGGIEGPNFVLSDAGTGPGSLSPTYAGALATFPLPGDRPGEAHIVLRLWS